MFADMLIIRARGVNNIQKELLNINPYPANVENRVSS